jgi:tRNA modification GTPase
MLKYSLDDTIAAIATPIGEGAIGIIKISGPESLPIALRLFKPARPPSSLKPYRLTYGHIIAPQNGETVDEVMAAYMPAPHSYTCQDVVEIQAHGGIVPLRRILQLVLAAGARPAEPGEMTLRAFMNGRIDLAQAEAVLDVVQARTEAALRVASEQLGGRLSGRVREIRRNILHALAYLEATIDFVEDEIPSQAFLPQLEQAMNELQILWRSASQGLIYRQGVRAAIVGRPNVGKSSLLNALLKGDRAIVTPIPGTTRDTLEETANINGIPVVLVDTAGIRAQSGDEVERLGMQRSEAALTRADIALLVVDASEPLMDADYDIARMVGDKPGLVALNKADLPAGTSAADLLPKRPHLALSALSGAGMAELEEAISDLILGGQAHASEEPLVSNPRHQALLAKAIEHLESAIKAEEAGLSPDLICIDVREAVDSLGQITGETITEELLNTIFSNFCIGK